MLDLVGELAVFQCRNKILRWVTECTKTSISRPKNKKDLDPPVNIVGRWLHGQVGLAPENKKAVLSQGEPRDAAVNFELYNGNLRAVSLPKHGFLVGLCLQTAVNHLSKSDK